MFIATHAAQVRKLRRSAMYSWFSEREQMSAGGNPVFMPLLRSLLRLRAVVSINMSLLAELEF